MLPGLQKQSPLVILAGFSDFCPMGSALPMRPVNFAAAVFLKRAGVSSEVPIHHQPRPIEVGNGENNES
jgi:hypothetical protein